jgi:hypothetical protein
MEDLLKYLSDSLYTPLITILLACVGLIISIEFSKGILKLITAYFIGFIILQGFYFYLTITNWTWLKNQTYLYTYLDYGFTIF